MISLSDDLSKQNWAIKRGFSLEFEISLNKLANQNGRCGTISMAGSQNDWIVCLKPDLMGLIAGTKVHLTQCISCRNRYCPAKSALFSICFPAWIELDQSPLNNKIIELNQALAKRKKSGAQLYCPKKKQISIGCNAKNTFCKYNLICGVYRLRTGPDFIKSIRWRREMVFVVIYLDGSSEVVNRNDFNNIDVDKVERVYSGNYEVRIVSELVPLGEEKNKLSETIAVFKEKYSGSVVTTNGLEEFETWFNGAANGETALIPEKILVPQKSYKIIKIKETTKDSKNRANEIVDEGASKPAKGAETALNSRETVDEGASKPAKGAKTALNSRETVDEESSQISIFDSEPKTGADVSEKKRAALRVGKKAGKREN